MFAPETWFALAYSDGEDIVASNIRLPSPKIDVVEAGGIEPPSEGLPATATTRLVCEF